MARLIKNRQLAENTVRHLGVDDALPGSDVTVPLARWQAEREQLRFYPHRVGVRLAPDEDPEVLIHDLAHLDLIAVEFPAFTDGRAYSQARLLRDRHGYQGEIRALGEVLRDQLQFMARCGIDAFELAPNESPEAALGMFQQIDIHYQPAADGHAPVWQQRRLATQRRLLRP